MKPLKEKEKAKGIRKQKEDTEFIKGEENSGLKRSRNIFIDNLSLRNKR